MSVIVTNYNYGHYLDACLQSLREQTRAADEIIVVDDGSTDGSAEILRGCSDVTVISQANGGQAAAFNTGFEASHGEIVMFVDADDKLHPQAVEVICRMWSRDISALSYGLSLIDGKGHGIGRYAMDLPGGDMLGRLLSHLTIPFMPTSGNAFRRAAIAWVFPLPTARWRISADALLIRAAVLQAPIRQIRQVLGAYRVHGQNNYFRSGDSGPWKANRGLRDVARAGLDLIDLADRGGRKLTRSERTKLLVAAVRCQLTAESLKFDAAALTSFRKKLLSVRAGTRLKYALALYLSAARRNARLRGWMIEPSNCPRFLSALPRIFWGKAVEEDLREPVLPRGPFAAVAPLETRTTVDLNEALTGPEWIRDHNSGGFDLCRVSGQFQVRYGGQGPTQFSATLAPRGQHPVSVSVFHNGLLLGSRELRTREVLVFTLPENSVTEPAADMFEFRTRDLVSGRFSLLSRMWRSSGRLQVSQITLEPVPAEPSAGVLKVASPVPMADLGDVVQAQNGRVLVGEELIGSGETLSLAVPPLQGPYCLSLQLSERQVRGHLSITLNGAPLCASDIVAAGSCMIEMPKNTNVFTGPLVLQFGFQPDDFLDDPTVMIAELCWLPGAAGGRYGVPALLPGASAGPGTGRSMCAFLGDGWDGQDDGTTVMQGSTARLFLSKAQIESSSMLWLDLEPLDALATRNELVLLASVNGTETKAVRPVGPARIEVPLDADLTMHKHKVYIDLYAATRPEDRTDAGDHGGIRLTALGLAPQAVPVPRTRAPRQLQAATMPDIDVMRLLADLRRDLELGADIEQLEALRDRLRAAVLALSPKAASGAISASDLTAMAALSAKLPITEPVDSVVPGQESWVRDLALCMLGGPAFLTLRGIELQHLPLLGRGFAKALGVYLVADPAAGAARNELKAYQDFLVEMMRQARAQLACAPDGSVASTVAYQMVHAFRARQLLFSDLPMKPHVEAFGQALEAMLLRDGHDLFAPQPQRATVHLEKRRIGVILHHTDPSPETWIWSALLRDLSRDEVDVTLFLTEQKDPPVSGFEGCPTVSLAENTLASSVAIIRSAKIDILFMGAYFYGHCFMTELCAHRMAPRQVGLSAVSPSSTGLSSVDTFVMGRSVAPKLVESDYSEDVVWAPGAGQAFAMPEALEDDDETRRITRSQVAVAQDDVMLVSGAMQDKIGSDVLDVWAQVLAGVPEAVLVLYPFAANWKQSFDVPAFTARVALSCTARGVDPQRVRILPPVPHKGVARILAASDLYLDSFPYSGATTTVEALRAGVPVVAMQGQTQRGQQAAGWLVEWGLKDLVAGSQQAYVKIALKLAGSAEERAAVSPRIAAGAKDAQLQQPFQTWMQDFVTHQSEPQPAPRYLFNHMPKTGGTSLRNVFGGWFELAYDYREAWSYVMPRKLDLSSLGPETMVCGHFSADPASSLATRYPETNDPLYWRKISFVRDPLERAISIYAYEKKLRGSHDSAFEQQSLSEHLRSFQSAYFKHFDCDEDTWRMALDSYWFIGTLERMPECLDYLAAQLGKPAPETLPHENATKRDEAVSEEDIEIFRVNNAIEYEIYDEIVVRLGKLLAQHARD